LTYVAGVQAEAGAWKPIGECAVDRAVSEVLQEYERRIAAEEALMKNQPPGSLMARRDEFLLPVGPETGQLLNTLIKGAGAKSILELGTSYGYSTVWLAEAARHTGGHVVSLELADYKARHARDALARAGLAEQVTIVEGSALDTLPGLAGPFDFVLIDLWKELYIPCLRLIYPKLTPGAFLAADNMLQPPTWHAEVQEYRRFARTLELDTVLLPIGSGVELSRRR
jgi:predicted O-methyltransferase YrrM